MDEWFCRCDKNFEYFAMNSTHDDQIKNIHVDRKPRQIRSFTYFANFKFFLFVAGSIGHLVAGA